MDLRRLKTFVTVAEQGTISKAANLLHITQPALSRQIARLEQELGFKLFGRMGRRLMLTAQGQQFVADCRNLLGSADAVEERARDLREGKIAHVRIAASALTIEGLFPLLLKSMAELDPGIKVTVIEADTGNLLGLLEHGDADLSISVINDMQIDGYRFGVYLLPNFHVLAACARSYSLKRAATIDVRSLLDHPLLLLDKHFATRAIFDAACRLSGMPQNVLVESVGAHALLALAEAGQGIAVIPSVLRADRYALRTMRVIQRGQPLKISVAVLWSRRRTPAAQAEAWSKRLAMRVRQLFPHG
jgi:DNA-binding transcriptional LysR family regulator